MQSCHLRCIKTDEIQPDTPASRKSSETKQLRAKKSKSVCKVLPIDA